MCLTLRLHTSDEIEESTRNFLDIHLRINLCQGVVLQLPIRKTFVKHAHLIGCVIIVSLKIHTRYHLENNKLTNW